MLRKRSSVAVVVLGLVALLLAGTVAIATAKGPDQVLHWKTMVGVPAGLTGAQSQVPLRGINGGGIAWTIERGRGTLSRSGHLEIEVEGLVLAAGANAGSNPSATFRGLVSCVNPDGTFSNVLTDPFPATTGPASAGGGNSEIEADVTLPASCIAPIVFVTSANGSWFASTGF
jgi:hypothetical protein